MKMQHLLLSILFLSLSLITKAQGNLNITGQFSPSTGPVFITVTYSDSVGGTYTSSSLTDSMGYFSLFFNVSDSVGLVTLDFLDCNNNNQTYMGTYSSQPNVSGLAYDFGLIPYCDGGGSPTLANFSGQFINFTSPVNFTISYDYNNVLYEINGITDSMGYFFIDSVVTTSPPSITFTNCNGIVVTREANPVVILPSPVPYDFSTIDYCIGNQSLELAAINGQFVNFDSPVNFTIQFEFNNQLQEIQGVCDTSGYFSFDSVPTNTIPTLSFVDCNGVAQIIQPNIVAILPYPIPYEFITIDYCPVIVPVVCNASFYFNQNVIIDSFNNLISVGNVTVMNSSIASTDANIISYTWDFGDGSPTYTGVNFLHSYANNGPYNLCLTILDDAGCTSTYCDLVMVDDSGVLSGKTNGGFSIQMGDGTDITQGPTAIKDLSNIEEIVVYPNPAKDNVSISFQAKENENITISILDLTGKILTEEIVAVELGANKIQWNVNDFNAGIYFLQIKNSTGSIAKRLNIQ